MASIDATRSLRSRRGRAPARRTTSLNNRLGIGYFGVNQQGEVFLRYLLATPMGRPLDKAMLEEVVDLLDYTQEHFSDYLEGVCEEEISLLVMEQVIEAAEAEPPL